MKQIIAFILVLLATTSSASAHDRAYRLLTKGEGWCARTNMPASFQDFQLLPSVGRRKQIFHSYLHATPEHSGTWDLKGKTLTIYSGDFNWDYRILSVTKDSLILLNIDRNRKERYFKTKCDVEQHPLKP